MERWLGKVAVVTGASSGIGAAIAVDLAKAGMIVIGLARRLERVEELKAKVPPTSTEWASSCLNIYSPTKYAVTAMTEVLRQEFQSEETKIKVTSFSPGAVNTEMIPPEFLEMAKDMPILQPEDISKAVMYVLGTPPHVQVHELIIKPVCEKL